MIFRSMLLRKPRTLYAAVLEHEAKLNRGVLESHFVNIRSGGTDSFKRDGLQRTETDYRLLQRGELLAGELGERLPHLVITRCAFRQTVDQSAQGRFAAGGSCLLLEFFFYFNRGLECRSAFSVIHSIGDLLLAILVESDRWPCAIAIGRKFPTRVHNFREVLPFGRRE